jgi:CubicO group peptidase (beta-lactamase class C family)
MKQRYLPGVAVALVDDQDTVWQQAFGLANVEKAIPASVDTVYKLWFVSKVFTAIETTQLVEEGLGDLDVPITDYFPDFSVQSRFPDSVPITIRSILAHHYGLPRNECYSLISGPEEDDVLREMAESLKYCHMAFPVGYRDKYTNIGPDMLGAIIQELREESFALYMNTLLARIGMENSAFLLAGVPVQKDAALGYEYYMGNYYPLEQAEITNLPSGNLYSTIEDMSDFTKFVFRGWEVQGEQIINPEIFKLMFEDYFSSRSEPQPMGLSWKIAHILGSELLVWCDGGPDEDIGSLVALLPSGNARSVVLGRDEIVIEGGVLMMQGLSVRVNPSARLRLSSCIALYSEIHSVIDLHCCTPIGKHSYSPCLNSCLHSTASRSI